MDKKSKVRGLGIVWINRVGMSQNLVGGQIIAQFCQHLSIESD